MKSLSQHLNESLNVNEAEILFDKKEIQKKLDAKDYKLFDELEEGDDAQNTAEPDELYTVIKKYNNIETARANVGDELEDEDVIKHYTEAIQSGASFASSLPVVLVKHNDEHRLFIYAPEKADDVDTLVVFK